MLCGFGGLRFVGLLMHLVCAGFDYVCDYDCMAWWISVCLGLVVGLICRFFVAG